MGSLITKRFPSLFDVAADFDTLFTREDAVYAPSVEIKKNDREYIVTAHLPGVKKEDLKVSVENGYLTVAGQSSWAENKDYDLVRSEIVRFKEFRRSLKIDERSFDVDQIEAKMENGVLTVRLPISAAVKPKQIEVKVG